MINIMNKNRGVYPPMHRKYNLVVRRAKFCILCKTNLISHAQISKAKNVNVLNNISQELRLRHNMILT